MLLNFWSVALLICGLLVFFLMGLGARSAVRILFSLASDSDSNRQTGIENESGLTSNLVQFGFGVQIVSLVVFMLAVDHFSQSIVGAMCATGSLLANDFGVPALIVKIGGVFFYGFWILLHQLDIRSPRQPLVRLKYVYLLLLLPLLFLDLALGIIFTAALNPDSITSCCPVVFGDLVDGSISLLAGLTPGMSLALFYGSVLLLIIIGAALYAVWQSWISLLFSGLWLWFFLLALVTLTTVFSSHIYGMPFYNCPFCMVKPEYHFIGYAIYAFLFGGAFAGMSVVVAEPLLSVEGMTSVVSGYQKRAVWFSLLCLILFTSLVSFYYAGCLFSGGEG